MFGLFRQDKPVGNIETKDGRNVAKIRISQLTTLTGQDIFVPVERCRVMPLPDGGFFRTLQFRQRLICAWNEREQKGGRIACLRKRVREKSHFPGNVNILLKEVCMTRIKSNSILMILVVVSILLIAGCDSSKKTTPHMGFGSFDVETKLAREHIVVLERVEGTSETQNILLGTIQVIDGENWKILGIPFFKDRYTCVKSDPCLVDTEDRAYYKALEATPEADAVFYKTMNRESSGIPLLWETKTVTFSGKAFTVKPDQYMTSFVPETTPEPETSPEEETGSE